MHTKKIHSHRRTSTGNRAKIAMNSEDLSNQGKQAPPARKLGTKSQVSSMIKVAPTVSHVGRNLMGAKGQPMAPHVPSHIMKKRPVSMYGFVNPESMQKGWLNSGSGSFKGNVYAGSKIQLPGQNTQHTAPVIGEEAAGGIDHTKIQAPPMFGQSPTNAVNPGQLMGNPSPIISVPSLVPLPAAAGNGFNGNNNNNNNTRNMEQPPQEPALKELGEVVPISLLDALKSEEGVQNAEEVYKKAKEKAKLLKTNGMLDKYVVNEEEAATLCAIPLLSNDGFDFDKMVNSCSEKEPSKLMTIVLVSLRKLPETRSVLYFEGGSNQEGTRAEGEWIRKGFVVASTRLDSVKETKKEGSKSMEIFRVENGHGYDIGDFDLTKEQIKNKTGNNNDMIVMEPRRTFFVVDSGIKKGDDECSVVILRMVDGKPIYDKEIQPGICHHIAHSVEENVKAFKILTNTSFDSSCK